MSSVMQQIVDSGAGPIAAVNVEQARVDNGPGYEAQGWALAQSVLTENMHQLQARGVWNRYVAKLCDFGTEARTFFVKALNSDTKQRREHVKSMEGHAEHELYRKANASAQVMVSNLSKIARAMNAGFDVECVVNDGVFARDGQGNKIPVQPFTTIVAMAQLFLDANATGKKKGRPALSFEAQLANFLSKTAKVNTPEDQSAYEKALEVLSQAGLVSQVEESVV